MAENLTDFMKGLETTEPAPFQAPQFRYGAEEDSLLFYVRNDESYAYRLNNLGTLFLSFMGDELVGCQVKGLRRKLKNDGNYGIAIKANDKVELGLFFHLLAYDISDPLPRSRLVELGQRAKGIELQWRTNLAPLSAP
jgi:hypothetical protein